MSEKQSEVTVAVNAPAGASVSAPASGFGAKFWFCTAIAVVGGLALGLIIGVSVGRPSTPGNTDAMVTSRVPIYVELQNSTISWNGTMYHNRKEMNASGPGVQLINGLSVYVVDNIAQAPAEFRVFYRNMLVSEQTLIHAHGMTPPWTFDGVPFLSAAPLYPGDEQLYSYPLTQSNGGTYFLHAHFDVHHGQGLSMPFIVHQSPPIGYPADLITKIENAQEVILFLQEFCPFYNGMDPVMNYSNPECRDEPVMSAVDQQMSMMGMNMNMNETGNTCLSPVDRLSVRWHAQMANRRFLNDPVTVQLGAGITSVRLRVINSAAQTNYFIEFGGLSATVIAADGQFVKPWSGETVNAGVWVGVSQRLDVILDIPVNVQSPVLISAREESPDYSLRSGIVLHTGIWSPSATDAMLATNTTGAGWWSSMSQELQLSAFTPLPNLNRIPDRTFIVNLKGHHGTINGYSYFEYPTAPFHRNPMPFRVQYGQRIHMIITNLTPEPHAMHLHGHHFQIIAVDGQTINGGGAMRDTVMVPAGCHNTTIAFDALNPGIHEFHCHMAYDMMAGMITTVEYVPGGINEDQLVSHTSPTSSDSSHMQH